MAEREAEHRGESVVGEDRYAAELLDATYVDCTFRDVDLTEAVTRGSRFQGCLFATCRLNASRHDESAFVACEFRRTSLFDATFKGCKMTGSTFVDCTMRPLTVEGGQWRSVTVRGANLTRLRLQDLQLQEADLSESDLTDSDLSGCDLAGASLRGTVLHRADLRRTVLHGVDLAAALLRDTKVDLPGAVALAEAHGAVVHTA